jgi:hypothetical protein
VGVRGEESDQHAARINFKGSHIGCLFHFSLNPEIPENSLATKVADSGVARLMRTTSYETKMPEEITMKRR